MTRTWLPLLAVVWLFPSSALPASDDLWLCKEESSVRSANTIGSCGVGTGEDENAARASAFENAKAEFTRICDLSADCKGHELSVMPKRTTCQEAPEKKGRERFKCYRLIEFTVVSEKTAVPAAAAPEQPATRCQIQLAAEGCPNHAGFTGTFTDDYDGSGSSQDRCLRRAAEYFGYCGGQQAVTARFLRGTEVLAKQAHNPATRCQIRLSPEGCPSHASLTGTFNDDADGSGASQDRCLRRAAEYFGFCGGEHAITASFFRTGKLLAKRTHAPATRCRIELSAEGCPNHAEQSAGAFNDDFDGSGSVQDRCLRRAAEYYVHCGSKNAISARFFRGGTLLGERVYPAKSQGQ